MFRGYHYFPDLKVSPSEIDGLARLPGPTKDLLMPTIRLRRWRGSKKFEATLAQIDRALGSERPIILDVLRPEKEKCEAHARLITLSEPENGYERWVEFIAAHQRFIPVLQVNNDQANVVLEAHSLVALRRGLAIRLRRESNWNSDLIDWLRPLNFGGLPVLIVFDYGQVERTASIGLIASTLGGLCRRWVGALPTAELTFTVIASSFPSNFAEIHRETERLEIVERQLHRVLADSLNGIAEVRYGDYASVFAGERGISRGGAPRVDLPKPTRWIYHRKETGGFQAAAAAVIADGDWDDALVIWGTDRIRDAAANRLDGLTYAQAWTAIRIHLHLHQQAHFGGGTGSIYDTDEEWVD